MNKNLTFKKDDITFDITTRAENVRLNGSNVKNEIERINTKIESLSIGEGGGIIVDNSEHNLLKINSEEGAHNFRFHNNKFSHKKEGQWKDINFNENEEENRVNSEHRECKINSENGSHNFRYYNGKFSSKNEEGEWEDLEITTTVEGIKLPPTKFIDITSRSAESNEVTIKWDDADDQILNGATIATWAGTKLIRKIDSPPVNEYDGELLVDNTERDKYKVNGFIDDGIELNTTYYYALFPYTSDGTYNFDISNIRKFYKTENATPNNTSDIVLTSTKNAIKLKWTDGESTSTSLWAGTKVVRKIGAPPTSETDGTLILDNSTRDRYKSNDFIDDTATQNVEYFYGFFPYSAEGHYNISSENIKSSKPVTGKIYSLIIDMNNQSPSDACTYADDAEGMNPGDDWNSIDIFNPKICTFKNEKVNYYLNPNKYAKKLDDEESVSNLNGIDGDVMSEISFIAIKFSNPNNNTLKISVTGDKQVAYSDLGFDCTAFKDKNGKIASKIYHGVYQGYIDSGNIYSKSGVIPQKYKINDLINACKARGEFFSLYSGALNFLFYCLYAIRFKTRSGFDNLINNNTTFVGETGTGNNNGLWYKGDVGKLAGIEWGAINSYLWLAGLKYDHYYQYWSSDGEHRTTGGIQITHPIDESKNVQSISNVYYYSTHSNYNSHNTGNLHGYMAKAKAYLNGTILPFPKQSGGSSSTHFVAYTNFSPAGTDSTASCKKDMYINFTQAPYKSFLNFYAQHINQRSSSAQFGTYLVYVKGDEE